MECPRVYSAIVLAASLVVPSSVLAISSPSFDVQTPTFAPAAAVSQTSPNFKVSASVEPVVGIGSDSANYTVPSGIIFAEPAASSESSGGGGGGGGSSGGGGGGGLPSGSGSGTVAFPVIVASGTLPEPTLFFRPRTFKSVVRLQGQRPLSSKILVNGSERDVQYPGEEAWERSMPLFYGANLVVVQAEREGVASREVSGQPFRMLIGDVDGSRFVDDADLSLLSSAWRRQVYEEMADFNEDGVVDDADLSLMASHWNAYY